MQSYTIFFGIHDEWLIATLNVFLRNDLIVTYRHQVLDMCSVFNTMGK